MTNVKANLVLALLILCATVACTSEVEVPVEVRVTREVEVTREIEVTREVEVTKEVEVVPGVLRATLCADYPYISELAELQLVLFTAQQAAGDPAIIDRIEEAKPERNVVSEVLADALNLSSLKEEKSGWDILTERLKNARRHQVEVCERDLEPFGSIQREMRTLIGIGVCMQTLSVIQDSFSGNPDWDNAPTEISEAVVALADGYDSYCDNDFLE